MRPAERISIQNIKRIANPEGRFGYLRLDKNEHLDMVNKRFLKQYKKYLTAEIISIYPEITETKKAVAAYAGVPVKHIFLSHGSDAAIKQVFDVFASEGSYVVLLEPTYAMYEIYAKMAGCNIKWIKCNEQFMVNKEHIMEVIDKDVCIVAIPNPNSPTGSEFDVDFLIAVLKKCQKLGVLLLIDEAYFPFSETTLMKLINKEENLVVTRTFSKAFALGGCRAGFLAASSNLIESIQKARPIYEINALSALAINVCLQNIHEMDAYVKRVKGGRDYLAMQCKKLGLIPYPAHTNFMNIRLPKKWDAGKLQEFSRANGILFKSGRSSGCFDNCIRVTLGPKIYMAKFVILLKKFMENTYGNEYTSEFRYHWLRPCSRSSIRFN